MSQARSDSDWSDMGKIYKSQISSKKYKWILIWVGAIGGIVPFLFGLLVILSFENSFDIVGAIAFTFGLWIIWSIFYELFIKPSAWSMLVIDSKVIWNTLSGIEYIEIMDIEKMEIFPDRQDNIAIRLCLKDGTVKGIVRDNCRDVSKASNVIKSFNKDIVVEQR